MIKKVVFILIAIVIIALVVIMAIIYHDTNPLDSRFFPQCMFYKLTGWQCPGCGGQRAFHYLLNGDIAESFRMNPLLWIGIPYILLASVLQSPWMEKRCVRLREWLTGYHACIIWLFAIVAFWILRNVF